MSADELIPETPKKPRATNNTRTSTTTASPAAAASPSATTAAPTARDEFQLSNDYNAMKTLKIGLDNKATSGLTSGVSNPLSTMIGGVRKYYNPATGKMDLDKPAGINNNTNVVPNEGNSNSNGKPGGYNLAGLTIDPAQAWDLTRALWAGKDI